MHNFLSSLKKQGFRLTVVRKYIIALLNHYKKPISAYEILESLKNSGKHVNKTTVYRELDFLLEKKIVIEIDFGDGKKRYEIASLPHHHHAICVQCKKVEDVMVNENLKKIEEKIYRTKNLKILRHNLEFFGLCQKCA